MVLPLLGERAGVRAGFVPLLIFLLILLPMDDCILKMQIKIMIKIKNLMALK
jgi:hypothetical protein